MDKIFDLLYKNDEAKNRINTAISDKGLMHAHIIEGDEGSGRKTLAKIISVVLAGGSADPTAMKIMSDLSPDVYIYDVPEKKKFIPVDTVREIRARAYIKPNELDIKVFIINNSQMMNQSAQNALLKLLEEPPSGVYFFLICDNVSLLLPTVRSRASVIRTERFTGEQIKEYLLSLGKYKEHELEGVVSGSIGKALEMLGARSRDKQKCELSDILSAIDSGNYQKLILSLQALPQDRNQMLTVLDLFRAQLRDIVSAVSGGIDIKCFPAKDEAIALKGRLTLKQILSLCDCIDEMYKMANLSMNVSVIKSVSAKRIMRACQG